MTACLPILALQRPQHKSYHHSTPHASSASLVASSPALSLQNGKAQPFTGAASAAPTTELPLLARLGDYLPQPSTWLWPNTNNKGARAEARLLSRLPFFGNTADATKPSARIEQVPTGVNGSGDYINTLIIEPPAASTASGDGVTNFVLLHGYATGLGFFYRNYEALASVPNLRVLSIDMPGFGRSSRPSTDFSGRAHPDAPRDRNTPVPDDIRAAAAEDFFVEQLEQWRQRLGLEKMVLAGHSFGGYMSACYAMRYPDRVEKLVLISPAGVPPKPDNYDDIITNGIPQEVVQKREQLTEYYEEQRQQVRPSPKSESAPAPRRKIPSWLISMWENNVTPQSIVRMLGPLGPKLVNYYVSHFRFLSEGEHEDLTSYMYHVTANRGSGEYALSSILLPLAYSRSPLEPRITEPGSLKMPVSFVYGSHDWMDSRAAYRVRNTMPPGQVEVVTIPRAGHNLFLDNPDVFNDEMVRILSK